MPAFKFKIMATSGTSTTQQVADQIRDAIKSGRFKPGERLPSETEIAEQLGMSRAIGKKAYRKLKDLGLFYNSGTGRIVGQAGAHSTRVSAPPAQSSAPAPAKPSPTAQSAQSTKSSKSAKSAKAASAATKKRPQSRTSGKAQSKKKAQPAKKAQPTKAAKKRSPAKRRR